MTSSKFFKGDDYGVFSPLSDTSFDLGGRRNDSPLTQLQHGSPIFNTTKPPIPSSSLKNVTMSRGKSFSNSRPASGMANFSPFNSGDGVLTPTMASHEAATLQKSSTNSTPVYGDFRSRSASQIIAAVSASNTKSMHRQSIQNTLTCNGNLEGGDCSDKFYGIGQYSAAIAMEHKAKPLMVSKGTQTGQDIPPMTDQKAQMVQNIQADFVRSAVEDSLEDFSLDWRNNFNSLYAQVVWQLMESENRVERTIGMAQQDLVRRLTDDNERLRAENEKLKAILYGKFITKME